jgi:hypothetical protein
MALGKPTVPLVFNEIIINDNKQAELRAQSVVPFAPMKELIVDKRNFRRGAETLLKWNTDKGTGG